MVKHWGVWGGTFDPVHDGYLAIAQTADDPVPLDGVFWVVTRHPPIKPKNRRERRLIAARWLN